MLSHFSKIPEELIAHIFTYLEHWDLSHCSQVCRKWRRISMEDFVWINVYKREIRCSQWIDEVLFRMIIDSHLEFTCYGSMCCKGSFPKASLFVHVKKMLCYIKKRTKSNASCLTSQVWSHVYRIMPILLLYSGFKKSSIHSSILNSLMENRDVGDHMISSKRIDEFHWGPQNSGHMLSMEIKLPVAQKYFQLDMCYFDEGNDNSYALNDGATTEERIEMLLTHIPLEISEIESVIYIINLQSDAHYPEDSLRKRSHWDLIRVELNAITSTINKKSSLLIIAVGTTVRSLDIVKILWQEIEGHRDDISFVKQIGGCHWSTWSTNDIDLAFLQHAMTHFFGNFNM